MLQQESNITQPDHWQKSLAEAIRDPKELLELLELPLDLLAGSQAAQQQFPMRVPHSYIRRMKKGDANDPLLRQVLPLAAESIPNPDYTLDPVGDMDAIVGQGLLKKYQGRALVMTTSTCAIHCRYCFRRHFPYNTESLRQQTGKLIQTLEADNSINEIILSGGDPLSLSDPQLNTLIQQLENIHHLKRLRIHSRFPVVLPERINHTLIGSLKNSRLKTVMVIHSNHPNEINQEVCDALQILGENGISLFNQAVLLKGVNDSVETLIKLSNILFDAGVTPYYLHALDRVRGAAHFDVSKKVALELLEGLRKQLPGYLIPRLVEEIPGAPYKQPL
jgi:EF-P beta-lysylation protein EpmB